MSRASCRNCTYFLFEKYGNMLTQTSTLQHGDHLCLTRIQEHSFRRCFAARRCRSVLAEHVLVVDVWWHMGTPEWTEFWRETEGDVQIIRIIGDFEVRRSHRLQSTIKSRVIFTDSSWTAEIPKRHFKDVKRMSL